MTPQRKRKKRRGLLLAELVILAVLTVALFGAVWVNHKLSLVNYDKDFDPTKVKTATDVNKKTGEEEVVPAETEQKSGAQAGQPVQTPAATPAPADSSQNTEPVDYGLEGVEMIALVGLDTRITEDYDGENSDTMMICCINHNTRTIKLISLYRDTFLNVGEDYYGSPDYYTKANEAYNLGGAAQFLSMLNLNLDLNITEYVSVEFKALATAIEMLGGIDVDLSYLEILHLNNYNIETSEACGMEYIPVELPPTDETDPTTFTYHLNGSQAVSYARIRYTDGFDFRRTSRQRVVLTKLKEKAKSADMISLNNMLNAVLPLVTTNMDSAKILSMAVPILSYSMTPEDQSGFPFVHLEDDASITGIDCVLPITLEYNVTRLHEFLLPGVEYYPSSTVLGYSDYIISMTGYDESFIEPASQLDDDGALPAGVAAGSAPAAGESGETGSDYAEGTGEYDPAAQNYD
ncbi:MAG: LCP family protein [Lachnospiraceae bacterium]|nr:LCP family protein [Lachnospiraceae bacterium]